MKPKLLCLLIAASLSAFSLKADRMIPMPIEELASRAQMILQGKVISKTVQRDAQGNIYTAADLQVAEVWKGKLTTNHFTVVYGGGILGDEGVSITGQVEFEVNEQVVVFLVLNAQDEGICIGLSQGKFHLWDETATGAKLAHNRFHGLAPSLSHAPPASPDPARAKIITRLTLADLKQRATGGAK
jgi:hypothetical protein